MSNFSFLENEFASLQAQSIKAESNVLDEPEISAIYSRKALENSVKFVYRVDEDLDEKIIFDPNENLNSYLKNSDVKDILPPYLLDELHYIRKVGNIATHDSSQSISDKESLYANQCLYKFQRWIVEVYSDYKISGDYVDLKRSQTPKEANPNKQEVIKQTNEDLKLLEENEYLVKELKKLQDALDLKTPKEKQKKKQTVIKIKDIDEKTTRKNLIDLELKDAGFDVKNFKNKKELEYRLVLEDGSFGYADYVLWNDDLPIAVIEAKRTSVNVTKGKHQAQVYANALKKKFGVEVLIFVTNGHVLEYKNELYPFREIHSFFPKDEILRALNKLEAIKKNKPSTFKINDAITDRYYQHRAIKSVLNNYEAKQTRALLVMATGSGKTRVAASITDILLKASWVRKVLFLADRKELVKQARKNFDEFLSETSVNLVVEKDLQNRMHFGTYETVHNLIRKNQYNSGFFDLIIVDEAHRSIYKKYTAIFEYFDSLVLGLTATPTDEIHRNTYDFFQTDFEEPTDSYTLNQAIEDKYLVNFEAFEIDLGIVSRGIKYAELSNDEKEEFEDKFENEFDEETQDDEKNIDSKEINKRILNKDTNEKVLEQLFEHGLKIQDGNKIGKTIIFAKNQIHAEFIKEVFDLKYPKDCDTAEIIHSEISHVDSLMDDFKNPSKNPQIAISVDMLDTGIDVPEILNLVFFKTVKSKTKFWQMIGRGTRLCTNVFADGNDKNSFKIFDFCQNFTYFDVITEGLKSSENKSLKERLFLKRVKLLMSLEESELKDTIQEIVKQQILCINSKEYYVKKHKPLIQELQNNSFEYINEDLLNDISTISQYIEDPNDFEVQRFEMLILNTQENILNKKNNDKNIKDLKEKAQILKSRDIKDVNEKKDFIKTIIKDTFDFTNINEIEKIKTNISSLANLALKKKEKIVKTIFDDKIIKIKEIDSSTHIKNASIQTEAQKVIEAYLEKLHKLKELEKSPLITQGDIDNLKAFIFNLQENIDNKINENHDFDNLIKGIINSSSKELANTILDNFISQNKYSTKQIEVMNKVKNIVFGKQYLNIKNSVQNINDLLGNDNHPISNIYDSLNENEQDEVISVIKLIEKIDDKDYILNNYEITKDDNLLVAEEKVEYS